MIRLALALTTLAAAAPLGAQEYERMSGEALYGAACAACHGGDGMGAPLERVAFDVPLPDFTDCGFATREADADWLAVAHEGGPVRGFAAMMPAFGDALTDDQLLRVIGYIRTMCGSDAWPRGELNLPRAIATEKAYPEDEAVWTSRVALGGPGAVDQRLVYEKRFGPRSQLEVVVPFAVRERDIGGWTAGPGDLVVGVKHALFHSLRAGSILSVAGEVALPTGDANRDLGAGTPVGEAFVSFGQVLPSDAFVQLQALVERPFDESAGELEGGLRVAIGRTLVRGEWGRSWTPMVELLGARDLVSGAATAWHVLPQLQVSLNTRQHVLASAGVRVPVGGPAGREPALDLYVLWDWFDGGLRDGW
jgi:mono/diheme cytochrome c family protein